MASLLSVSVSGDLTFENRQPHVVADGVLFATIRPVIRLFSPAANREGEAPAEPPTLYAWQREVCWESLSGSRLRSTDDGSLSLDTVRLRIPSCGLLTNPLPPPRACGELSRAGRVRGELRERSRMI